MVERLIEFNCADCNSNLSHYSDKMRYRHRLLHIEHYAKLLSTDSFATILRFRLTLVWKDKTLDLDCMSLHKSKRGPHTWQRGIKSWRSPVALWLDWTWRGGQKRAAPIPLFWLDLLRYKTCPSTLRVYHCVFEKRQRLISRDNPQKYDRD